MDCNDYPTDTQDDTYDTRQDDDIDASLLCPDVILDEKNGAVLTINENNNIYYDTDIEGSSLDYNITGIKARFELTEKEEQLRNKIYELDNPVQNTKIHCTSCNTHLGSALCNLKRIYVHPLLSVLICDECFQFYTDGTFEKDVDGTELYCRWCGQGGQVFCCSVCPRVFCKMCVRLNFPSKVFAEIRDADYWECFACDPSLTTQHRVQCFEFARYVRTEIRRLEHLESSCFYTEIDYTQCCQESDQARKRKLKDRDPDFVPFQENNNEKLTKKIKVEKNETEWKVGVISNTELVKDIQSNNNSNIKEESNMKSEKYEVKFKKNTTPGASTEQILLSTPKTSYVPMTTTTTSSIGLPLTMPTSTISVQFPTPLVVRQIDLPNQSVYRNQKLTVPSVPIFSSFMHLPATRTETKPVIPLKHLPLPVTRTIYATSQTLPSTISFYSKPSISNNVSLLKRPIQPALFHLKKLPLSNIPNTSVTKTPIYMSLPVVSKFDGANQTIVQSKARSTSILQPRPFKPVEDFQTFLIKARILDRLLLSTSLSNSSCSATLLRIQQLCDDIKNIQDMLILHDSLQKSLKTMTESLSEIKHQLTNEFSDVCG